MSTARRRRIAAGEVRRLERVVRARQVRLAEAKRSGDEDEITRRQAKVHLANLKLTAAGKRLSAVLGMSAR